MLKLIFNSVVILFLVVLTAYFSGFLGFDWAKFKDFGLELTTMLGGVVIGIILKGSTP